NPYLKPEYTDKLISGLDLKFDFGLSLNSLLYYKESKDLILWTPLQSYWQPKNIQQAIRKGYKTILSWQSSSIPIILNTQYNYNISEDRTPGEYYKKPLRYAPKITSSFSVSWRPQNFSFFLQLNHVSRRIATYSWPEDQFISPYTICLLNSSYTFTNRFGNIIITAAINNLSDLEYETLLGYPEPSRSFRLSINYERN
ncbi:MAG: TonB-dependent receptor, partial [bacterium]